MEIKLLWDELEDSFESYDKFMVIYSRCQNYIRSKEYDTCTQMFYENTCKLTMKFCRIDYKEARDIVNYIIKRV